MKDDFIPFHKAEIDNEEKQAVLRVLESGWLTTGTEALEFEKEFSDFVKSKFSFAVSSATAGLMLCYAGVKSEKRNKILTSPYTFTSTANAALHAGCEVCYADVEDDGFNIDPARAEEVLDREKSLCALVPVHFGGNPCNMEKLNKLAKEKSVAVIEDAAHAFPSLTAKGFAGTLGSAGVFSFYATKTITTGEGGMVCTDDEKLGNFVKKMRLHGIDRNVWDRYTAKNASWLYDVTGCGHKCNLPDILAAIGRSQLKKATDFLKKRKSIAAFYNEAFSSCAFLKLPPNAEGNSHHLYPLRLNLEALKINRDEFAAKIQEAGIGISVHFIPHFFLAFWKNRYNLNPKDFPNAHKAFLSEISLPIFPQMTESQREKTAETIIKIGRAYER